jgi:hypothetical protein
MYTRTVLRTLILSIWILPPFTGPVHASCPEEDSTASLTLTSGGEVISTLSLEDLDSLPQHSFQTTTQWTEGPPIEFTGPTLSSLLERLGVAVPDTPVRLVAANRYSVVLPVEVLEADAPIVATRRNGCTFGVRDLGPLWVVFPYDADPKYRTEEIYSTSIWQLMEVEIDP